MPTFFLYALSNSTAFDGNLTNSIYTNNKYLNEDTAQQKQLKNDSWNIKNLVNAENSIFGNKNVTSVLSGLANIAFGGVSWSIGITALATIMTGGLALAPMLILGALAGTSALYGFSNMGEGVHQVLLGANGKGGEKSYNILRDTVFQGNSELYHAIGIGSSLLATGGMSGLSQGGTLVNMVKGMGKEVLKDAIGGGSGFLVGNAVYEATGSKILSGAAGIGAGLYAESSINKLLNPVKNVVTPAVNSVVNDVNALEGGTGSKQLLLDAPSGTNPWLNGSEIKSIVAPKDFKINMAMSQNQTLPGGWGTLDNIDDVNFVRNQLAVTPEFKADVAKVQQYLVPEGTRIQIGTVGPQTYKGVTYPGGGNQVQILNYLDRSKLIPVGDPIMIK